MKPIAIVGAKRTPIGRFLGSLAKLTAVDLAVHAGRAAIGEIPTDRIDEVVLGNVLSAGVGMNLARQVAVELEVPVETPAYSVNMMCGSGMQSVLLAMRSIDCGAASVVLCGGSESMSNAPHLLPRVRKGIPLGEGTLVDSILQDGLHDSFGHGHMAMTAEKLAKKFAIDRSAQDAFALQSQQRWAKADAGDVFRNEIQPHDVLQRDEHPRPETTIEQLTKLRPAFDSDGTITAGNASGINDGAAMLLVCDPTIAQKEGWPILATITYGLGVGCEPAEMGLGPVHAIKRLCESSGESLESFDRIEINEAFAAQGLACTQQLELENTAINTCGGAIAMGHPIGASGARLVVHIANQIAEGHCKKGIASLCVGGGMGVAVALRGNA